MTGPILTGWRRGADILRSNSGHFYFRKNIGVRENLIKTNEVLLVY